ncbi:MAG: hypothetical protein HYV28_05380 [Ignavibacteriales bacterium]|nr:hypothetical protein [Ignavibacteriales bacterium]
MLNAIYHPSYLPDMNWYKIQLLIWDNTYRIVPHSVEDKYGAQHIAGIWDLEAVYLPTKDIRLPSHDYFESRKSLMINQFKRFSKIQSQSYTNEDYFHLNTAKIPDWVATSLLEYNLRKTNTINLNSAEHYEVREDVSDYLMSCIAHYFNIQHGLSPVTDKLLNCFSIYSNQVGIHNPSESYEGALQSFISAVFNFMVPNNISYLSFKDVIEIRNEYIELRESLVRFLEIISNEFRLEQIIDPERMKELLNDAISKFKQEKLKFEKNTWRRIITDWRTQSISLLVGAFASYLSGGLTAPIYFQLGGASIRIANHMIQKNPTLPIKDSLQYFSNINQQIIHRQLISEADNYYKVINPIKYIM